MFTLYARKGWGSVLVEAQLEFYGLPFRLVEVGDLFASGEARAALREVNPLAQVPTLVLPDGTVMTESAAITLLLADITGRDDLVPGPGAPERAAFLRWLVFLVTNIYPCFTFADDPARFVAIEAAQRPFRIAVDEHLTELWGVVEPACASPHFLGERFSALDIFAAAMTRWRPRRPWFAEHCPRLSAVAAAADHHPRLEAVWDSNFSEK
jgi:GST-like protein